jgi:hypothetical protein
MVANLMCLSSHAFAYTFFTNSHTGITTPATLVPKPFSAISIQEFLELTPKRYKELTGKKMSLSQKISLKILQYKVRRAIKKNKPVSLFFITREIENDNFDIPGFILGIALGPLGILIAYLIEGKSSAMFRWSLYGAIIWLGIFLLVVLIL